MTRYTMHHGDCREVMATLDAESVDAIVCDPPYGLSFMGKGWDHGVPGFEFWAEAIRVAKPGAHLLAFGGTRTYHRLACAIEDAGWEIRDCVMWVYGSGFPKSHDVSKAIDKAAGENGGRGPMKRGGERLARLVDGKRDGEGRWGDESGRDPFMYAPATDAARQWSGWGTALKPAYEPVIVARKPLCGTVAENVLRHGTGGINVDGCRVDGKPRTTHSDGNYRTQNGDNVYDSGLKAGFLGVAPAGRWPANVIHDGSDEVVGLFPDRDGAVSNGSKGTTGSNGIYNEGWGAVPQRPGRGDSGSAARFFYCAKASREDRGDNHHPTVKPTALMRYLCRLVTPPGGVVLDPFTGSGSTGKAAIMEGFRFIGVEREAEYVEIARARIAAVAADRPLLEATA